MLALQLPPVISTSGVNMTNVEQGLRLSKGHRYSISQLLALSASARLPFDLSKFSFDAARAGVIPSLDDCTMNSRRSSVHRARMTSDGSTSVPEERTMLPNTDGPAPERLSQPPPATLLAQQHAGFARFLKKHSSPTHQRVTAGGRIVPMESRRAPPPFSLVGDGQLLRQDKLNKSETREPPIFKQYGGVRQDSWDRIKPMISSQPLNVGSMDNMETAFAIHNEWNIQSGNTAYPTPLQDENMNAAFTQTSNPSNVPASYPTFMSGNTTMYGVWPAVCTAAPAPATSIAWTPTTTWPQVDSPTPLALGGQSCFGTSGYLDQPIIWAQNALSDWNQRYNELDQQLKTLDKHRAMTTLTSEIASQRREIVQQRADSKNMINLITSWLSLSRQVQPGATSPTFTASFNVDAPAYIPVAQQSSSCMAGAAETRSANGVTEGCFFQRPPDRSMRKPIAIVPPPKLQTDLPSQTDRCVLSAESSSLDDVDSWGVKVGLAPPDLMRHQNEMLESINEAQSQSVHSNQSQESLQSVPQGGFFGQDVYTGEATRIADQVADNTDHLAEESVYVLPAVKTMYKEGLDALRRPRGTVTAVKMLDGSHVDVEGQDLTQPDLASMSTFEKDYWRRSSFELDKTKEAGPSGEANASNDEITTTPIRQMLYLDKQTTPEGHTTQTRNGKENIAVTPMGHRKAATDAFVGRFDANDSRDSALCLQYAEQSLRGPADFGRIQSEDAVSTDIERPLRSRWATLSLKNRSEMPSQEPSTVYIQSSVSNKVDRGRSSEHNIITRSGNTSAEMLNNKAFSSTSVQNVNAIAQLPQNLDGTTDNSRGAKSIFSLVAKVRSPRLLRRTTATGGAWYGPHCREIIERALICDNEEPSRLSPKRVSQ